ncbi:PAS domain-containing protein [Jannaschia pohangensis]|uniref:PAS domain-containing protein n=1 Tax=Jannaschia pohangensis TaxID=390807 RepID=UPI00158793D5|nr:PAS domain-containing protein [Jannaschia pohangensis]
MTLSDPRLPNEPLILANEAFYRMSGYSAKEALGANCRFMQGKETQKSSRNTIRGDFAANRDTKVLIRNYRKSGEAFDNFLYIFSVFDSTETPLFRIGSQFEVPALFRAKAFQDHASELLNGLKAVNDSGELARNQMIETGALVGASVKSVLMARLETLRFN